MTTQGKSDAMRSSEAQAALDALSELENAMGRAIIQWGAAYGRIDVSKAVQALAKESGIEADMATLRHEGTTRVVFVYRVPAKSPATGLQVRRIPADTWACGRRDSATIRIRSVPSGIRGMPAAFRSWSRRTLNCGRSGIAGSSEANIFRDNSTRRAGRVAGKRPRSPRTDRKDAAGVLDVRPAKPMVGKGAGHVRRRSMKRMQRRFRPRVRTAVGPST